MKNKIEILCPGRNCPRCKKMVRYLKNMTVENGLDVEIVILTSLTDLIRFRTWILPSVFVNGHKVARGYKPKLEMVKKYME